MFLRRACILSLVTALLFGVAGCDNRDSRKENLTQAESKIIGPKEAPTIRLLAWVGYNEPDFVSELEKRAGIKLQVKTYVGGDEMEKLFKAAPEPYDLVVVDAEYGEKLFRERKLSVLPDNVWRSEGLFSPFDTGGPTKEGKDVYGAVVRWGALGLVYNSKHLSSTDVASYSILWEKKVKGRVGIFEWYLPNMGVFSRYLKYSHTVANGGKRDTSSFSLTPLELDSLRAMLVSLKPQVRSIQPSTGDVIADLKSGDVWITPSVGEWAAAALQEQGQPIEWTVPNEGGVMWIESLAVPEGSSQKEIAYKVIQTMRQPEMLALLAWRKAYVSQSPSRLAYSYMDQKRRAILRAENSETVQQLIGQLEVRKLPGPSPFTLTGDWMKVWNDFKTSR